MTDAAAVAAALEPLFGPADVPNRHRAKAKKAGAPAEIIKGRRPTSIAIAQNLRQELADWREANYAGASDTSRELLFHWFHQDHEVAGAEGTAQPFSYYFCQREAIETLIYLYEVRGLRTLSGLTGEFTGTDAERAALGISPDDDRWARYAFKIATGAGKTKTMSLAIVWSYFHSLREPDSTLARDFVLIAPGITVFERLKEDFKPVGGGPDIFDNDPVIPPAWRSEWNVSVVLQDEPSAASTGGTIYLTNIHRLYDAAKRRKSKEAEEYDWMGPKVSKKALDPSEELRQRIVAHERLMILNDEAHHVWDPGSAWNEAIGFLHRETEKRGSGLVAQLDFSATPKDDKGQVFRHVVVDTPLGEAVDGGIVKTPIIGHGEKLVERPHDDAAHRYENHLTLGYKRWQASFAEWQRTGKKPLLFVMTESTDAADQIAHRLNTDPLYSDLNGKTVNLHINLKGKLRKRGRGATAYYEFVEAEKQISDEDLQALRKLSRELDRSESPYLCIVSVLMLREGWDVRNVTTIVPLRPLTAKSKILPEQTLGRGLRRMTPPGEESVAETVTVVEHASFVTLYEEELADEGLPIEMIDVTKVPRTTVTIYPDAENKDLKALDLEVPRLSHGYRIDSDLSDLDFEDVRKAFSNLGPLPLGEPQEKKINYEGRHLITDELVEQMKIKLPLLSDPIGAISFYREELERAVKIKGTHERLAPLLQRFIEELLFEETVELYDKRVVGRLADSDVRTYIRATFVPLLRSKVTRHQERLTEEAPQSVTTWKPFQATHSETHPAQVADRTPFNLAPCNRQLEVAMTRFLDRAEDVAAFATNQGPQCLRIDALTAEGRRSLYAADFLIRRSNGGCVLAETKGRRDPDVAGKARAAAEWCKAASTRTVKWEYLYVPEQAFKEFTGDSVDELIRTCRPMLKKLLDEAASPQVALPLGQAESEESSQVVYDFISEDDLGALPLRARKGIQEAALLFDYMAKKRKVSFSPVFQPLLGPLDTAAEALLFQRLEPALPETADDQSAFFNPDLTAEKKKHQKFLENQASLLRRFLVHRSPITPIGMLCFCLAYAAKDEGAPGGIFVAVRERFSDLADTDLGELLGTVYDFRNTYVAHVKDELGDRGKAEEALRHWIDALGRLTETTAAKPATSTR
ncbi:MAG: DEAD/DEAH box helicase family protein [Actinomycetota bacterium]